MAPHVYIVDDDESFRAALERLMRSAGLTAQTFASAQEFLDSDISCDDDSCLITDVQMPGKTGLELQRELRETGKEFPVIFVTAHDTDEARSQTKKAGAVGYFRKPVDDQALLDAIRWAVSRTAKKSHDP